jgi:hypothetical protein
MLFVRVIEKNGLETGRAAARLSTAAPRTVEFEPTVRWSWPIQGHLLVIKSQRNTVRAAPTGRSVTAGASPHVHKKGGRERQPFSFINNSRLPGIRERGVVAVERHQMVNSSRSHLLNVGRT